MTLRRFGYLHDQIVSKNWEASSEEGLLDLHDLSGLVAGSMMVSAFGALSFPEWSVKAQGPVESMLTVP